MNDWLGLSVELCPEICKMLKPRQPLRKWGGHMLLVQLPWFGEIGHDLSCGARATLPRIGVGRSVVLEPNSDDLFSFVRLD